MICVSANSGIICNFVASQNEKLINLIHYMVI